MASYMRKVYSIQRETRPPYVKQYYFWGIVTYTLPIEGWGIGHRNTQNVPCPGIAGTISRSSRLDKRYEKNLDVQRRQKEGSPPTRVTLPRPLRR
jgi:hypothetical protein